MAWIAGERVVLRAWERDDVRTRWETDQTADATEARLRDWHEAPKSLQQREAEFDAVIAESDATDVSLIIEAGGRAVGDINLFEIDTRNCRAAIGLSIWRPEDRGKGYGTDALRALMRWGFHQLNLHRIELSVDPGNDAAIHIYESLGFVEEGRRREAHYSDGCYVDDVLMAVLRQEFTAREHRAAP
ncbi:MAG TPA: GNAT family protein [Dehalococcoidia bacterium]|jgi:RimJ/RimL family protein N-acetyltransferase